MDLHTKPINVGGNSKSTSPCMICGGSGEIEVKRDGGRVEKVACSCVKKDLIPK